MRELFEPCLRDAPDAEALVTGAASLTAAVLRRDGEPQRASGVSAAAMHGLYWLARGAGGHSPSRRSVHETHPLSAV